MLKIGRYNKLTVSKRVDFGVYLTQDDYDEILMPNRYVPEGLEVGDEIEAFIYTDSEDRLVAVTDRPKVQVGECAYLKVVGTSRIGAFLDWGLPKDLFVPSKQQSTPMKLNQSYVVYAYLDEKTDRVAASSKYNRFFKEESDDFYPGQQVDLMICAKTDLGFKAIINNGYLGMLFKGDLTGPLQIGKKLKGYIKKVRSSDGRIDLSLAPNNTGTRQDLNQAILLWLDTHEGTSNLTDKSSPEDIFEQYGVSKGNYKKALGALYKQKKIVIEKDHIRLVR